MTKFGHRLLGLWELDERIIHLNHGSFGACPRSVLAAQQEIVREIAKNPDRFFRHHIMPGGESRVRVAAGRVAAFVGARGQDIAIVENATTAVDSVLRSASLAPGDEILVLDHGYNAVRLAIEETCRRTGAQPRVVPLPVPLKRAEIVPRIAEALTARTRLAIIDHITSATALLLPLEDIIAQLKQRNVPVFIDGAHAVGLIALDLPRLGADWYASNAHKWLFTPTGAAFLFASPGLQAITRPAIVSHFHKYDFPASFDYVGTRDPSPGLAIPAALDFLESFGVEEVRAYLGQLADEGHARLTSIGAIPSGDSALLCPMRAYILPQTRAAAPADAEQLVESLYRDHSIQVKVEAFQGKLLLRTSAQIYLDGDAYAALAQALDRDGWPARA